MCQLNTTFGTADEVRAKVPMKWTGHDLVELRCLKALLGHVAVDGRWWSGASGASNTLPPSGTNWRMTHG